MLRSQRGLTPELAGRSGAALARKVTCTTHTHESSRVSGTVSTYEVEEAAGVGRYYLSHGPHTPPSTPPATAPASPSAVARSKRGLRLVAGIFFFDAVGLAKYTQTIAEGRATSATPVNALT